jgi:hypothetical protein
VNIELERVLKETFKASGIYLEALKKATKNIRPDAPSPGWDLKAGRLLLEAGNHWTAMLGNINVNDILC